MKKFIIYFNKYIFGILIIYIIIFAPNISKQESLNIKNIHKQHEIIKHLVQEYYNKNSNINTIFDIKITIQYLDKILIGSNVLLRNNYTKIVNKSCLVIETKMDATVCGIKNVDLIDTQYITLDKNNIFYCSSAYGKAIHSRYCDEVYNLNNKNNFCRYIRFIKFIKNLFLILDN